MADVWYDRSNLARTCAGILEQSMGARNRVGKGCRTGLPGYIGWWNRFLGSLKYKNSGSGLVTYYGGKPDNVTKIRWRKKSHVRYGIREPLSDGRFYFEKLGPMTGTICRKACSILLTSPPFCLLFPRTARERE